MKFCYADESGHLGEITVVAGVVVDAIRMHRTKEDWESLLSELEQISNGRVLEIKGRELYRGNSYWREWDGGERSSLIDSIINWMIDRKHSVTFGAISRTQLAALKDSEAYDSLGSLRTWSIAALHLILGIQKTYQRENQNKGKTVFVFDNVAEHQELLDAVNQPPAITNGFYSLHKKQRPLDNIVDVPFFADSRDVGLIQVADLFAYIFHLFAELTEGTTSEKFAGELERVCDWLAQMRPVLMPDSARWPQTSKDPCTQFLRNAAPQSLLKVRP